MATRAPVQLPRWADQLLALAHVDWRPPTRQPSAGRVVLATVLALVGSLVADAVLVAIGEHVFPATRNFVHFRVTDYGALTVIGVLIACAGWPVVTRITSTPRWLFFRLAIAVTLVLFLPDLWILVMGETAEAVAVLMMMHLAIALVTYNALVNVAPAGRRRSVAADGPSRAMAAVRPVRGGHVPDDVEDRAPEGRGAFLGTARPAGTDRPALTTPDVRLISSSLAAPANVALRRPVSSAGRRPAGGPRPADGRRPATGRRPVAAPGSASTTASATRAASTGGATGTVGAVRPAVRRRDGGGGATRLAAGPLPGEQEEGVGRSRGGRPRHQRAATTGVVDDGRGPSRNDGGRRPSSVARPPASLSEPMSAVRVLPRGSRPVEAAIAAEPAVAPEPGTSAEPSGRPGGRGRHVAGQPPVDR